MITKPGPDCNAHATKQGLDPKLATYSTEALAPRNVGQINPDEDGVRMSLDDVLSPRPDLASLHGELLERC